MRHRQALHGVAASAGNSQHLTVWHTPSHVLRGLLFYAALRWLALRRPFGRRLVAAA